MKSYVISVKKVLPLALATAVLMATATVAKAASICILQGSTTVTNSAQNAVGVYLSCDGTSSYIKTPGPTGLSQQLQILISKDYSISNVVVDTNYLLTYTLIKK